MPQQQLTMGMRSVRGQWLLVGQMRKIHKKKQKQIENALIY